MSLRAPLKSCLIVGAGIAGLLAAERLQKSGVSVTVLDKSTGVGGRMATRRMEEGVCDHGAQFFTARDAAFAARVNEWIEAGAAREWGRGFAKEDGIPRHDGYPRYAGIAGMNAIPRYLARNLDVRKIERVLSAAARGTRWEVRTERGAIYSADALLMTPPVPQSLEILNTGNTILEPAARQALETISYEPCIAVLALLTGPSALPPPGALQLQTKPIAWIADNHLKGISPNAFSITIHAGPEFSRANRDLPDNQIADRLLEQAHPWLPFPARAWQVHRWRYAKPVTLHPERCLLAASRPPLVFAGDAFGSPRIEGAALSGLAAAQALLTLGA